jgi:hypothetical protein
MAGVIGRARALFLFYCLTQAEDIIQMSIISHVVGHAVGSPAIILKTLWTVVVPWFVPTISVSVKEPKKNGDVELDGTLLYGEKCKELEPATPCSMIESECTDLVPYVPPDPTKIKLDPVIPSHSYWPQLIIQMPSATEIGGRILNNIIIDLPMYTCKSLYNSPIPTAIALYTILPGPIWNVLFPRLLRYLTLL